MKTLGRFLKPTTVSEEQSDIPVYRFAKSDAVASLRARISNLKPPRGFIQHHLQKKSGAKRIYPAPSSNIRSGAGFTLIELVVVMSIIVVLSSILVSYSKQNSKQLLLSTTESRILSLVSRAKFLSIETYFEDLGSGPIREICGYGVYVNPNGREMFIFQDRRLAVIGGCPADNRWDPGNDVRLSGTLDALILNPELMTFGGNLRNVVFIPPDPEVIINEDTNIDSASIDVSLVDGSGSISVIVNDAGQVRPN